MANESKISSNQVERLSEIKDEIKKLMQEAKDIIRCGPPITWERTKGYCYAHIMTALDNDHNYVSREMFTLQDIIDELESHVEGQDDEAPECPECKAKMDDDGDD